MGYLYEACDQISDFCHQQLLRKMCIKMSIYVPCVEKSTKSTNRKQESNGSKNVSHDMGYLYEACHQISDLCHQQLLRKMCIYMYVQCVQKPTKSANRKQESDGSKNASHNMAYLQEACDQISDSCHQQLPRKMRRKMCIYKCTYTCIC